MVMRVHCPRCSTPLTVPQDSSGRGARCPLCKGKFRVPDPDELVEETISCWIEEAVDEDWQAKQREWDEQARIASVEEKIRQLKQKRMRKKIGLRQATDDDLRVRDEGDDEAAPTDEQWQSPPPPPADDAGPSPAETICLDADDADDADQVIDLPDDAGEPDEDDAPTPQQTAEADEPSLDDVPPVDDGSDQTDYLHEPEVIAEVDEDAMTDAQKQDVAFRRYMDEVSEQKQAAEQKSAVAQPPKPAPAAQKPQPAPRSAAPAVAPAQAQAAPVQQGEQAHDYPGELFPQSHRPHLVVQDISQSGVVLAFDSCWLEHAGFRASLPMRCIFTGEADKTQLIAKPLAFIDRSQCKVRNPREVERNHEIYVTEKMRTRDLLKMMGLIENLPQPFNRAMPYFTHRRKSSDCLTCQTRKRSDGGITCEVTVPEGDYALHWLAAVNGVCGEEYELLQRDVGLLGNDAWAALSDTCRQRIGAWAKFGRGEAFRLYLNDAEFGKADEGLAGVIVTDKRLVYHKYHHEGEVELAKPITLHIAKQETMARISLEVAGKRAKVGNILVAHLDQLREAIGDRDNVRFVVKEQQAA